MSILGHSNQSRKYTADKTYRKNEIFTVCNARLVSICESNIHYVSKKRGQLWQAVVSISVD